MSNADHAPEGEVATGMTEDQAASALLDRWVTKDEEKSEESTEAEDSEPTEDDAAPEATAEPEESNESEAEESGEVEIDVAGEKFKLPAKLKEHAERIQAKAKEVEAGATRKFQEAADLRKAVETRAQQVEHLNKIAHAQADLLADHKFVTRRLAQFEQINVQQLGAQDPAALTRINAEYNQLTAAKQRIEAAYQKATHDYQQTLDAAESERISKLDEFASKTVKDWSTDRGERLKAYALKTGMTPEAIRSSLSPEFIKILDDAEFGARVRNASPQKKTEVQKTLKPGSSAQTKTSAAVKAQKSFERVQRTGKVEDAANALLARMGARKR
jgi:hypothetical protein